MISKPTIGTMSKGNRTIKIKRAYESPDPADGYRVLVDRLWPRGMTKSQLSLDAWDKRLAPSDALRRWFAHDPLRWSEFKTRYQFELRADNASSALDELAEKAMTRTITLVYGARDDKHNHAIVLEGELVRRVGATPAASKTRKTR